MALQSLGKNPFLYLPSSGGSRCSLTVAASLPSLTPRSHCLLLLLSHKILYLIRTFTVEFRAHPDPYLNILNWLTSAKTLSPSKFTFTGPSGYDAVISFGGGWTPSTPLWGFSGGSGIENLPVMQETQETQIQSLGLEDPLEEGVAIHSSILAWRIPMDRGAWWATVHGIIKNRTQPKWLSTHACMHPIHYTLPNTKLGEDQEKMKLYE